MSFDLLPASAPDAPEPVVPAAVARLWDVQTLTLPLALLARRPAGSEATGGIAFARKGPSRRGYGQRAEILGADATAFTVTFGD